MNLAKGGDLPHRQFQMPNNPCSREEVARLIQALVGLPVSHAWKGYTSTIFLELGQLTPPQGMRRHNPSGQASISVEWGWRVENKSAVLYGSSSTRPKIAEGIQSLVGTRIVQLKIEGLVPELVLDFSNGHRLRTMIMEASDPRWHVKLLDKNYLFSRDGNLFVGSGEGGATSEEDPAGELEELAFDRWGESKLEPVGGRCENCAFYRPIDGDFLILFFGVCISADSPFDGKAVSESSGCPAFVQGEDPPLY